MEGIHRRGGAAERVEAARWGAAAAAEARSGGGRCDGSGSERRGEEATSRHGHAFRVSLAAGPAHGLTSSYLCLN